MATPAAQLFRGGVRRYLHIGQCRSRKAPRIAALRYQPANEFYDAPVGFHCAEFPTMPASFTDENGFAGAGRFRDAFKWHKLLPRQTRWRMPGSEISFTGDHRRFDGPA